LRGAVPSQAVDDLTTTCLTRGAPDNMTAVMIAAENTHTA
jgi:serine/threonine protein phosphatase PrpC